jgi:hypothetical protein
LWCKVGGGLAARYFFSWSIPALACGVSRYFSGPRRLDQGHRRAEVIVRFHRRPVALSQAKPPSSLHGPHPLEGLPGGRVQLARGVRVVHRQHRRAHHHLGIPPPAFLLPTLLDQLLELAANIGVDRRIVLQRRTHQQVAVIRVAGKALAILPPVGGGRVEKRRRGSERKLLAQRLVGRVRPRVRWCRRVGSSCDRYQKQGSSDGQRKTRIMWYFLVEGIAGLY